MIEDQKKLQTELGVKLAVPVKSGDRSLIVPSLRSAWLRDWDQNNPAQAIGFSYTENTVYDSSHQDDQNGVLLEAGLNYTTHNIGSTSFKVYARGGVEIWDSSNRNSDWRASGGFTFQV